MAGRLTLEFLKTESSAGLAPVGAAAAALILANSPWAAHYFAFLAKPVPVQFGAFAQTSSLEIWVREGLMAAFFLVVGMQIKFEALRGELSSPRRLTTPILAALGGMAAPALVYLAINLGSVGSPRGWPVATPSDIAFALAALSVAAPRLPASLRLFLLTVAIADDFGSVALIAVLYTHKLVWSALAGVGVVLAMLASLSRVKRAPLLLYAVGFVVVWGFCLKSGVDTSVAGVACALTVPIGARRPGGESMLTQFMDALHPWVAYGVLPLFAFTAAGVSLRGLGSMALLSPVAIGVAAALLIGKPLGVFGVTLLASLMKIGRRPSGAAWIEVFGVSILAGVGFTMSLYLGDLAFGGGVAQSEVRLGVIAGSLASAVLGCALLSWASARRAVAETDLAEGI